MAITIERTKEDEYVLYVDGNMIETYQQTRMEHPKEWADDAINAGASQFAVLNNEYEYIDRR